MVAPDSPGALRGGTLGVIAYSILLNEELEDSLSGMPAQGWGRGFLWVILYGLPVSQLAVGLTIVQLVRRVVVAAAARRRERGLQDPDAGVDP